LRQSFSIALTVLDLRKFIKGKKISEEEFYAAALKNVNLSTLDEKVRAVTPEPDSNRGEQSDESDREGVPRYAKLALSPSSNASPTSALQDALTASRQTPRSGALQNVKRRSSHASASHKHRSTPSASSLNAFASTPSVPQGPVFTPESYSTSPSTQPGNRSHNSSPRWSFSRSDIDRLAYSTLYAPSLQQTYGVDNLNSWSAIMHSEASDTSSLSDFDVICPKCHRLTSDHFTSLCNLEDSPVPDPTHASRDILNSSPGVSTRANHFSVPEPTKQHDAAWKWVSHCFSACIYYSRDRYTTLRDHNLVQKTPAAANAPADFAFARWDLDRAKEEFKVMLLNDDANILIALTQTVMILSVHNWKTMSSDLLSIATEGTLEMLGMQHPISIMVQFAIRMTSQSTIYQQHPINSETLRQVWHAFVNGWTSPDGLHHIRAEGDRGRRAIPAMYCFASLLCAEAGAESDEAKRAAMLAECEYTLRSCYHFACDTFHSKHLQALQAMVKLQLCLERQGRIKEAIECTERAVQDGAEILGKWHPRQLETLRILAELYLKDGRDVATVELLYWDILEGRLNMLGRKHESTLQSRLTLQEFLQRCGRWSEGCPEQERINDMWNWVDVAREDGGDGVPGDHVREAY
jgi:hypothetical protein